MEPTKDVFTVFFRTDPTLAWIYKGVEKHRFSTPSVRYMDVPPFSIA